MQPPQLPSSSESESPSFQSTSDKKKSSSRGVLAGCGYLVLLVISISTLVSIFWGKDSRADTPLEQQLAYLDFNERLDESSPVVAEYKKLLEDIAQQFEITEKEAANMTYFVVKNQLKPEGFKTTTLEMLRVTHKAATSRNANLLGKGTNAYSHLLASLVAQMEFEKRGQ